MLSPLVLLVVIPAEDESANQSDLAVAAAVAEKGAVGRSSLDADPSLSEAPATTRVAQL